MNAPKTETCLTYVVETGFKNTLWFAYLCPKLQFTCLVLLSFSVCEYEDKTQTVVMM